MFTTVTACRPEEFHIDCSIIHKPTGYCFTPYAGRPRSGAVRMGDLGRMLPDGRIYDSAQVIRTAMKIWERHIASDPQRDQPMRVVHAS